MESILWKTSTDGTNGKDMKTPSSYKIDGEDLDHDSYRSVVNGNLIRNIIKRRGAKVSMSFILVNEADVDTLLSSVNKDGVKFRFLSPAFGANKWITFDGYVSKMNVEFVEAQVAGKVSFNVVQLRGASWQ